MKELLVPHVRAHAPDSETARILIQNVSYLYYL
jgi:hypothetical protein